MKSMDARVTKALPVEAVIEACDNSGAKLIKVFAVKGSKTVKRRKPACGVGDLVMGSVVKGKTDMEGTVVFAIVVRQKKEYRRNDGTRIKFEDNAVVVLKDDKGNPKGTIFKGPIAKEATLRWPGIAKLAGIVV